jgi:hypothetical protein
MVEKCILGSFSGDRIGVDLGDVWYGVSNQCFFSICFDAVDRVVLDS